MRNLKKDFENKTIDYNKLVDYGFSKKGNHYFYEQYMDDYSFKVVIELSTEKQISKVIDLSIDEEYILVDVQNSTGNFVGKIKEEYEHILYNMIEKCSKPNVFKSSQAKEVIKYIKEKYNDDLEYLWKQFPHNAIWRNQYNNKWYGALLVVSESKLGISSEKIIDILDLRYPKEKIREIIDDKNIFEGYHMNKNHWITVKLDGSVTLEEICTLIDQSYELSLLK